MRVPVDPVTWISELRSYDFAYGTRIHGNIAALLAGTPSVVLVHDSRTLELSRYFELPHRMLRDVPADIHPQELADAADYAPMLAGHRERFSRLSAFLDKNSLENTYSHGDRGAAFDAHVAKLDLPPCIGVWDGSDDGGLRYRLAWLREQMLAARSAAAQRDAEFAKTTAGLRQSKQGPPAATGRDAEAAGRNRAAGGAHRKTPCTALGAGGPPWRQADHDPIAAVSGFPAGVLLEAAAMSDFR